MNAVKTVVYLAGRYDRREELQRYAKRLEETGHFAVNSRWLSGAHEMPISSEGVLRPELINPNDYATNPLDMTADFALDDLSDVDDSDMVISFTEEHTVGYNRGGRHVELGIALGLNKIVAVVGPRENVFHYLPSVEVFENLDQLVKYYCDQAADA